MEIDNDNEILKLKNNLGIKKPDDPSKKVITDLNNCAHKFNSNYELWLDKYKPVEYGDLLTDEKMTRDILCWIKSWDELVFNKKFESVRAAINKEKNVNEFGGGNNFTNNFKKEFEFTHSKYKIILIAGPPGMGKTTLARVLANHCKYEPIVINASDERTSDKLLLRVYDATQLDKLKFRKQLGDKEKPTCLILDEIDGAMDGQDGKSAIRSIIDFIKSGKVNKNIINKAKKNILSQNNINSSPFDSSANLTNNTGNTSNKNNNKENKNNNDSDDDDKDRDRDREYKRNNKKADSDDEDDRKGAYKNTVKRPIICICNDLYAKVLMPLRKEALVFNVKADPAKLEKRLREICQREKLNVDLTTIKNLCKQSNFDIRACINTLQFLSYNQNNTGLLKTLSYDKLFMLGSKDITAGLFEIWNKVFFYSPNEMNFYSTLQLYNSYGEFERINDGIFVNYISNPVNTNELATRAKLLDFLSYDDILTSKINSSHNYEMTKFQCLPGAYAKLKYSSNDKNKNLKFPTMLIEYRKNKKNNKRILASIKETFDEECPFSKVGKKSLVCDTLPYVYQLIQPEIREINPELMNKIETKGMRTAINIMCQFGIKFYEGRGKDGEEDEDDEKTYEPDLQDLLNFNEKVVEKKFYTFNYGKQNNNKESLIDEIKVNTRITSKQKFIIKSEFERIKNYKNFMKESTGKGSTGKLFAGAINAISAEDKKNEELKDKIKKIDFFGSANKKANEVDKDKEAENKKNIIDNFSNLNFLKKRNYTQFADPEYKFVYKYNEGVTNSVRRTLNLNYFFK